MYMYCIYLVMSDFNTRQVKSEKKKKIVVLISTLYSNCPGEERLQCQSFVLTKRFINAALPKA